jgi:hypothetical protein
MIWWPYKLYSYVFCERHRVREGGEAALRVVRNRSRPLESPRDDRGLWKAEVEEAKAWLTEKRKMRSEASQEWLPVPTGSRDLDTGLYGEHLLDKVRPASPFSLR